MWGACRGVPECVPRRFGACRGVPGVFRGMPRCAEACRGVPRRAAVCRAVALCFGACRGVPVCVPANSSGCAEVCLGGSALNPKTLHRYPLALQGLVPRPTGTGKSVTLLSKCSY